MSLITNTQSTNGTAAGAANGIGSNGEVSQLFTTLLVAQIKNQNPLEPADPSEFVNQMTQLSQMEALQNLATQTTANGAMLESMQVLALGGQVGSEVTATTSSVVLGGEPVRGRFTLADSSADVAVILEGEDGQQRRIDFGTRAAGETAFTLDPATLGLPAGTYSIRVDTASKQSVAVEVAGTLRNVRLSASDGLVLNVANVGQVLPGAITGFQGRDTVN
jgi:flagellar basal-body rod modification protein FlgD